MIIALNDFEQARFHPATGEPIESCYRRYYTDGDGRRFVEVGDVNRAVPVGGKVADGLIEAFPEVANGR